MEKGTFTKDIRAFGSVRGLTTAAMLTAMSVVIGIFCKTFLNFGGGLFRITFENLPIVISGLMFGPLVGAGVGFVSDFTSYCLSAQSFAISPIVTLGAMAVGTVAGFVSHYLIKKEGNVRIIVSGMAAHIIGSMIIKPIGIFVYYGWAVLWRIPMYLCIAPVEILIICLMYKNKAFGRFLEGARKN